MELTARIDYWGRVAPERVVHRSGAAVMTWGELVAASDRVAAALAADLAGSGEPVIVRGHKEPEMLVAFVGCRKAGHPYIPVDSSSPDHRVEQIRKLAGVRRMLEPARIRELARADGPVPMPTGSADTPHYIMFTSGSTGEPKGVVVTRGNLDTFLAWMIGEQRFAPGEEVYLNQALFSFDLSVMDTWTCLATGGTLVSVRASDVADFKALYALLEHSDLTTWVSTPPFARYCLAERRFAQPLLPRLRRFLFCGDVLPRGLAEALLSRFPAADVWNTYGPTEATVATTSIRIDPTVLRRFAAVPIGRCMPGSRIRLERPDGSEVEPGERGEIVIAGPNVAAGYISRPDLTARVFTTRNGLAAYRTGDTGWMEGDLLFFGGRGDGQVKIAGHRIEVGDVEAHLSALPRVGAAVVLPSFRDGLPEALHAFVVLREPVTGSRIDVSRGLRAELARELPGYMLPRRFHFLDAFPLTVNGKVDRSALAGLIRE